jgi:hypothetical protein
MKAGCIAMNESVELLKRLAARHRQVAQGLRNDEVKAVLLQLAQECEDRANELASGVAEARPNKASFGSGKEKET